MSGVAKDGRAILIYPIISRFSRLPGPVVKLMMEYESRGAIVGTAEDVNDGWDIVADDAKNYKRKQKSFGHLYWANKQKEKKHDSEE